SWLIEIRDPLVAVAPEKTRVVMLWSDEVKAETLSALTAHLAATQQGQPNRPDTWDGGLLIIDGPNTRTRPQRGAAAAGVVVQQATTAKFGAALDRMKTPIVYLDVSNCSRPFILRQVAPRVNTLISVHRHHTPLPAEFDKVRRVIGCSILPPSVVHGETSFASNLNR